MVRLKKLLGFKHATTMKECELMTRRDHTTVISILLIIPLIIGVCYYHPIGLLLFTSVAGDIPQLASMSFQAYGTSDLANDYVELSDNNTGMLAGWNPDGEKLQFKITDSNVTNRSIISTSLDTVPVSGLTVNDDSPSFEMKVMEDSRLLYLLDESNPSLASIFVLDPDSDKVLPTHTSLANLSSYGDWIIPNWDRLNMFVCCVQATPEKVAIVNLVLRDYVTTIDVGPCPQEMDSHSGLEYVYLLDRCEGVVYVIDGQSLNVTTKIRVGSDPVGMVINDRDNKIYVLNSYHQTGTNGTVSVINSTTNVVTDIIQVGKEPLDISIDENNNKIYVANMITPFLGNIPNGTVSVIDSLSDEVIDTIPVGKTPNAMVINPFTHMVYVNNWGSGTVSVIDGSSNKVIKVLEGTTSSSAIAINEVANTVYLTRTKNLPDTFEQINVVSIINGSTNEEIGFKEIGFNPSGIFVDTFTNKVYVKNIQDEKQVISIINGNDNSFVPTNLSNCYPSTIGSNQSFWLKCTSAPSEGDMLKYLLLNPSIK